MLCKSHVSQEVLERVIELINSMHCQEISGEGKHAHPWHGVSTPVPVEVSLHIVVENTVSTSNCISFNTLSEIAWLFWDALKRVLL